MFQIGEFSKIARVSTRLLRYYDEIGLFSPIKIDDFSGYRFYSADQLPALNRILALRDLGLTLDQIVRMVQDDVNVDEMRGMLMMRKAEIEQTVTEELNRLMSVESRLRQIDGETGVGDLNVIIKDVPDQHFMAMRQVCAGLEHGIEMFQEMMRLLPAHVPDNKRGFFVAISHSAGFPEQDIDLEMGILVPKRAETPLELGDGYSLSYRVLPGVETMASVAFTGNPVERHLGYAELGIWAEQNGYELNGNEREIFIEPPVPGFESESVTEIQIPVKKLGLTTKLLP